MARPKPVPPYLRVVEASAWLKALEHLAALLGGHPDAGVADPEVQFDRFVRGDLLDANDDLAFLGELDGVVAEVDEDLSKAQRIADQGSRHVGRGVEQQFQALVFGLSCRPDWPDGP
jgi:hypothetical protein